MKRSAEKKNRLRKFWNGLNREHRVRKLQLLYGQSSALPFWHSLFSWDELPGFLKPYIIKVLIPRHPDGFDGPVDIMTTYQED